MNRAVSLLICMAAAHFLSGCDNKPVAGATPMPPAVTVSRPLMQKITEWDEYTGRLDAYLPEARRLQPERPAERRTG